MSETSIVQNLIDRIRKFAEFSGKSKFRLATEAGLGAETLRKFEDPDWNPTRNTLEALVNIIPENFDHLKIPKKSKSPSRRRT